MFGQENVTTHFTIGDEVIATADDNTKIVTVRRQRGGRQDHADSMGKNSTPDQQRRLHRRRPVLPHDHGLVDVRRAVQLAQRISHRGRLGHPDVLQRHLRPLRAVVGGRTGLHQHQPRLPERQPEQRASGSTTTPSAATSSRSTTLSAARLPGTEGLGDWNIPWPQWKAGNANA